MQCKSFITLTGKKHNIFEEQALGQTLREPGKISVSFSPRVFPTAARESTAAEEEEVSMDSPFLITLIVSEVVF